jgi:16S rRNA (cytosine1402-N4)-methyltransferase
MAENGHVPVLFREVMDYLQPRGGGTYIDGTLGAGGHTAGLLQASAPNGRVLAFDRDPEAIAFAGQHLQLFQERLIFANTSYADMTAVAAAHGMQEVDGILLDLGLSSRQLADGDRGFSFMNEGPLDMRFDPQQALTAADLVNNLNEDALADIFWRYGEVKSSRRIARAIAARRPLTTTTELAAIIAGEIGRRGRIHPATQVFQALRIAVNSELDELERGLMAGIGLLKPGGRMAIISFHSLEDRFVKQSFRALSQNCICPPQQPVCTCGNQATVRLVTRKAVQASPQEQTENPRSRSARLRVVEKLAAASG